MSKDSIPKDFATHFPAKGGGSNIQSDIQRNSVSKTALQYPDEIPQAALNAISNIVEAECRQQNLEFFRCKTRDEDPNACLEEGKQTTLCVLDIFKNAHRNEETRKNLDLYSLCLEQNTLSFYRCRKEEKAFYESYYKGKEPKHLKFNIGPEKRF